MIALENLLTKFEPNKNYDYEGAQFKTHVPSAGRSAYLNIIFSAADKAVQQNIIDPLRLPSQVRAFYEHYNGAHLFLDLLSIYGFRPAHYQINRSDLRKSLPYDLVDSNKEYIDDLHGSSIVLVGSYGFDRSEVLVERTTGLVHCTVGDDLNRIRCSWNSFEEWIEREINRLSECFDEHGIRLVGFEETLPTRGL